MKTIQIQKRRRKTMNKKEVEGIEKVIKEYLKKNLRMESRVRYLDAYSPPENYPRLIEVGFTIKEIAEMMGFGICLVRDYYNNYRNLTQGTNYYIHSKRKKKS